MDFVQTECTVKCTVFIQWFDSEVFNFCAREYFKKIIKMTFLKYILFLLPTYYKYKNKTVSNFKDFVTLLFLLTYIINTYQTKLK